MSEATATLGGGAVDTGEVTADTPPGTTECLVTERVLVGRAGVQGQGPYIYLFLIEADGKVQRAWFECHGCPSIIRCGDWVTKWAVGREPQSLLVLEPKDLELVVGGLPLGKEFCARLTVEAMRGAVGQFMASSKI